MRKPGIISGWGEARAFGDTYALKCDLHARIMRKVGVEVDCAPDISQARAVWPADSYSLVLVDLRNDPTHVREFCAEIRSAAEQLTFPGSNRNE